MTEDEILQVWRKEIKRQTNVGQVTSASIVGGDIVIEHVCDGQASSVFTFPLGAEISSHYDEATGWLAVTHDVSITWDELQAIKDREMGVEASAVEVYPQGSEILNKANVRHLWRVPSDQAVPDLNLAVAQGAEWIGWTKSQAV